jgi:arylsulfatase A
MNKAVIFLIVIWLLTSCNNGSQTEDKNHLNFIIIHVDDLGWTDLSSFGSEYYETPNIDRLVAEGIKFTDAYSAAAVCSPSRAAMITGKYPVRLGITDWIRARFQGGIIPEDSSNPQGYMETSGRPLLTPENYLYMDVGEFSLSKYLQGIGYATSHVGKWHLGQENQFPEHHGFDYNYGGCDLGQPPSYFDPYVDPNGREYYVLHNLPGRKAGEYLTDREGDEAVNFIKKYQKQKFFLHWAPYAVHTPIQGKEELIEKYERKPASANHNNPVYAAMVESLDDNVGKVLDILDELDLAENTFVIFTSDNGGLLGGPKNPITSNAPLRSGKGYQYEGGIRVPLIIRWPGIVLAGSVSNTPVSSFDYMPTIVELTGETKLAKYEFDGVSMVGLLRGTEKQLNRDLFWHFPHYRGNDVVPYSIIRSGNYKLIKYYDGTPSELYDLESDISETNELSGTRKDKVKELETAIEQWTYKTGARLPKRTEL